MTPYLAVFGRGWLMVTLVAMNTRQIATGHLSGAVVVGFLISWVWWANSSAKRPDMRGGGIAYGLGAACGTATGYLLASWWGG